MTFFLLILLLGSKTDKLYAQRNAMEAIEHLIASHILSWLQKDILKATFVAKATSLKLISKTFVLAGRAAATTCLRGG